MFNMDVIVHVSCCVPYVGTDAKGIHFDNYITYDENGDNIIGWQKYAFGIERMIMACGILWENILHEFQAEKPWGCEGNFAFR